MRLNTWHERRNKVFWKMQRKSKPRVVYAKRLWKTSCHITQDRIQNESIKENLGLVICTPYLLICQHQDVFCLPQSLSSLESTKKEVDNLNLCSSTQISTHKHTHTHTHKNDIANVWVMFNYSFSFAEAATSPYFFNFLYLC